MKTAWSINFHENTRVVQLIGKGRGNLKSVILIGSVVPVLIEGLIVDKSDRSIKLLSSRTPRVTYNFAESLSIKLLPPLDSILIALALKLAVINGS